MEKEASPVFYTWMKFSVEQNTEYEIESDTCEVTLCYLSGNEDMLETGVRYLEKEKGSGRYLPAREEEHYNSSIRETYHFAPWKNWMNDPNGLCYFKGYYHMFYQFNPHGQEWCMYWGHAASKDLVHWVHLPVALAPQKEIMEKPGELVGGAFSGCAVVEGGEAVFYLTRHIEPRGDSGRQTESQWMMKSKDMIHFTEEKCLIERKPEGASFDFRIPRWKKSTDAGIWCWRAPSAESTHSSIRIGGYGALDLSSSAADRGSEGIRSFECPDFMELDGKYVAIGLDGSPR